MRKRTRAIFIGSVFAAGVAATSALYAQDNHGSSGSMMGRGGMMEGGMMGSMMQMMDHCGQMMQGMNDGRGAGRPNDQWKKPPGDKN